MFSVDLSTRDDDGATPTVTWLLDVLSVCGYLADAARIARQSGTASRPAPLAVT